MELLQFAQKFKTCPLNFPISNFYPNRLTDIRTYVETYKESYIGTYQENFLLKN